jgi:hypothetical protein
VSTCRDVPFSDFPNPGAILQLAHTRSLVDSIAPAPAIPRSWPLRVLAVVLLDRADRAGLRKISHRQIGALMGMSHTQVARILKAAKEDLVR